MSAFSNTQSLPTYLEVYGNLIDVNQPFKLVDLENFCTSSANKLFHNNRAVHGRQDILGMFTALVPAGGRLVIPNVQAIFAGDTGVQMAIKKEGRESYMEMERDSNTLASLISGAFTPAMKETMFQRGTINGARALVILTAFRLVCAGAGVTATLSSVLARVNNKILPSQAFDGDSFALARTQDLASLTAGGEGIGNMTQVKILGENFEQDPHLAQAFKDSRELLAVDATAADIMTQMNRLLKIRIRPSPYEPKASAAEATSKKDKKTKLSLADMKRIVNTKCHRHGFGFGHNTSECKAMKLDPSLADQPPNDTLSAMYRAKIDLVKHIPAEARTTSSDGGGKAKSGKSAGGAHAAETVTGEED